LPTNSRWVCEELSLRGYDRLLIRYSPIENSRTWRGDNSALKI
jgi:hypothetical protein